MALRPFVTAGVAFAAAGAVAATVAIAPPMSPGEVRVAQKTEEKLALTADTRDLINTFFGQFPGDPDNSGTTGVAGVVQHCCRTRTSTIRRHSRSSTGCSGRASPRSPGSS